MTCGLINLCYRSATLDLASIITTYGDESIHIILLQKARFTLSLHIRHHGGTKVCIRVCIGHESEQAPGRTHANVIALNVHPCRAISPDFLDLE